MLPDVVKQTITGETPYPTSTWPIYPTVPPQYPEVPRYPYPFPYPVPTTPVPTTTTHKLDLFGTPAQKWTSEGTAPSNTYTWTVNVAGWARSQLIVELDDGVITVSSLDRDGNKEKVLDSALVPHEVDQDTLGCFYRYGLLLISGSPFNFTKNRRLDIWED